MAADPGNIINMKSWPTPTNTTSLRGFLGLIEYYWNFIQNYGNIVAPLTKPLKKDGFKWSKEAEEAFQQLKQAMVQAPVLALLDFSKLFFVEADASGNGLGVVLMQEGRPIAFYSKAFLNEQRITTVDQQRWIVKLMGFDYEIEYRPGCDNKAADAFSRLHGELATVSCPQHNCLKEIHKEARSHSDLVAIREAIVRGDAAAERFKEREGMLWYQGRLVIPASFQYKLHIIREFHDTPIGGHSGVLRSYKRVAANFFWVGMKRDIQTYIQQCGICQHHKYDKIGRAHV